MKKQKTKRNKPNRDFNLAQSVVSRLLLGEKTRTIASALGTSPGYVYTIRSVYTALIGERKLTLRERITGKTWGVYGNNN